MTRPIRKILTVVGARPQFIKSAPVSLAIRQAGLQEVMVHTGQHYDANMSEVFFEQLKLMRPQYPLEIGSGSHAYQTGEGLKQLEGIIRQEAPDAVLVYGDTNATIAGALAAVKIHVPVAHIEAGLRSFNRRMPEEVNRVVTDHVSSWLFAPTDLAVANLRNEGITQGVFKVGDVMLDAAELFLSQAESMGSGLFDRHQLQPRDYILLTLHRAETTDTPEQVHRVLRALDRQGMPVLFPTHPRVRPLVQSLAGLRNIRFVEPLSYLEMLQAEKHAQAIVTDSGGVQKEAAFFSIPCITLREQTEWVETVESGWNRLVGLCEDKLVEALGSLQTPSQSIVHLYGDRQASRAIVDVLASQPPLWFE